MVWDTLRWLDGIQLSPYVRQGNSEQGGSTSGMCAVVMPQSRSATWLDLPSVSRLCDTAVDPLLLHLGTDGKVLADLLREIPKNVALEKKNNILARLGAEEHARWMEKWKQATAGAAMALVTRLVWTCVQNRNCYAPLLRALDTQHLWDPTQDDQEVLGFLKKWRPPKGKDRQGKDRLVPKEDAHVTRPTALGHIVDWLDLKEQHQLYSLGVAV